MQNEIEKAKQHVRIDLQSELTNAGVTVVHEDEQHQEVSSALQSAHPGAGTTKDAAVPQTAPTPNLIRFPEKPMGSPMTDTAWGFTHMARKLEERLERKRQKGELPNAA